MYVGSYDAPVRDLCSYRLRLEELALLGFRSVGLAISWEEHPRELPPDERQAIAELAAEHDLEIRFHPDLARVDQLARREKLDLLACARRELAPILEWALDLGVITVGCDSIRAHFDETVEVFRLMVEMTRGTQLQFAVENSQRGVINSPAKMNEAVERVGSARMGLLVDVGHIHTTITQGWNECAGPGEFLTQLRVPVWDTHFHNNAGATDAHLAVTDPEGTLDMRQVVAGLHAIGYEGPLNLECTRAQGGARTARQCSMRDMEEAIVADRDYLEQLVAQVQGS